MRQTVFVSMEGNLNFKNIYVEKTTKNRTIQSIQADLNYIINKWKTEKATAENCKAMWEELYYVLSNNKPKIEKEEDSEYFNDVISQIEEIGNEIAFIGRRKRYHYADHATKCNDIQEEILRADIMGNIKNEEFVNNLVEKYIILQLFLLNHPRATMSTIQRRTKEFANFTTDDFIADMLNFQESNEKYMIEHPEGNKKLEYVEFKID